MRLTRQDLRGTHFEVLVQNATGAYDAMVPVAERSYIGTVDGYPDAVSSGIIQDDGVFRGAIYFDRGRTWFTLGSGVIGTKGDTQPATFGKPEFTSLPGQAGSTMYGFDVGFDASYEYFANRAGSDVAKTFEYIEFNVAATRALYMTNLLARPYLARVIIRTDKIQDPANGVTGANYMDALQAEWNTNHTDANRDLVAGISTNKVGGGLAWVGVLGGQRGFSINDSTNQMGEFTVVWRHELGHNWGMGHYEGGAAEGATINSNNQYARMSGAELARALNYRPFAMNFLDNEGTYTAVDLPPYASMDSADFLRGKDTAIIIDVLANDHDANGTQLELISVDPVTVKGGTVVQQGQRLIYTPGGNFLEVDSFTYKIRDAGGQTATGAVAVDVRRFDALQAYLPLNETSGKTAADLSRFHRSVVLSGGFFDAMSTPGKFGTAVNLDGADDHVSIESVGLETDTITLSAWIKPAATQNEFSGIIVNRAPGAHGLNFGTNRELRYQWNGGQADWNSGLIPAANSWTFVALVVEPGKATIYMNDGTGFQSAVNHAAHAPANFGTVDIGWDSEKPARRFTGAIDEVRIHSIALDQSALQALVKGGRAESPVPFDGAVEVTRADLSWIAAGGAVRYHVYLGTDVAAVSQATPASPEYLGDTTNPQMPDVTTNRLKKYFWRVDVETASETIPGDIWSFTRDGNTPIPIVNHSFEAGSASGGVPTGWTLPQGMSGSLGTGNGGTDGNRFLYIGPGMEISQDLNFTLIAGETLTLTYQSSRSYLRKIQLLTKDGNSYSSIAETSEQIGSAAWPTTTLTHIVTPQQAGKQLAISIISSAHNEFDNFQIIRTPPAGPPNNPPVFSSDPLTGSAGTALNPYGPAGLSGSVIGGSSLVFTKLEGPSWLEIAADGTFSGTPPTSAIGQNSFLIGVSGEGGGVDFADLIIEVGEAVPLFEIQVSIIPSGVSAGKIAYSFKRSAHARANNTVTLQLSDDLVAWPANREIVIGADTASSGAGVEILNQGNFDQINVTLPTAAPKNFMRLKLTEP